MLRYSSSSLVTFRLLVGVLDGAQVFDIEPGRPLYRRPDPTAGIANIRVGRLNYASQSGRGGQQCKNRLLYPLAH